ncbi:TPA: hypothetical protein ACQ80K_003453 [Escherichia coli]|nr:hypothetical protein [Escherichia coli]KDY12216.1 hypothetical protein AC72_0960 [Escherichia coli 2-316-03_S4_C1]MDO2627216.1 hypothetical protein [Escherichia coli]
MALALDGGIHFTEMKRRTRKEGLKRRNKEEYEMDRLTPGKRQ